MLLVSSLDVTTGLCGPGRTKVPRNTPIPEIAQLYALGLFRADFRSRYPVGETFSEWDLVGRINVGTGQVGPDLVLRQIKTDFRNYYAKNQKNRLRIAAGTPASGLIEGRSIRADGLGIGLDPLRDAIVAELMEVTTIDEAAETIAEDIQPKVALLQGPIKTLVDRELAELRLRSSTALPSKLIAYGTPWIIPPPLSIVPIFQPVSSTPYATYRWICFAPTYTFRPMPIGPFSTGVEPENAPARGLIVYSYHEAASPAGVPHEVIVRIREWAKQQARREQRLELLPISDVTRYWEDNTADLKKLLAYAAGATLAVAAVVLAIYLAPVIIGGAAAYLTELAAAASLGALFARSAAIVAAISTYVPAILRFTQTLLTSARASGTRYGYGF